MHNPQFVDGPHGVRLAYSRVEGQAPRIAFLGGFRSEMSGTKATYLDGWARRTGRAFLRFDYSGHGASSGEFASGTISRWTEEAVAVLDAVADDHIVLVGSSMGAWIMTRVALARPVRVVGMVGIAAAPDFTEDLWGTLNQSQRRAVEEEGWIEMPSRYDDTPDVYTKALFNDGRACRVLTGPLPLKIPVRLIHGTADEIVPWIQSQRLMGALTSDDVTLTLVKGGDHRLSHATDLAFLSATVATLCDALT